VCVPKTWSVLIWRKNRLTSAPMVALILLFFYLIGSLLKSKGRLEAENAALRHQLTVLQRKARGRVQFTSSDRLFLIMLYRWFPSVLKAMMIIRLRPLCAGIVPGFDVTGAGDRAQREPVRRSQQICGH
jgi:hypothetical protein